MKRNFRKLVIVFNFMMAGCFATAQSFDIFLTCVKKVDECTKLATFGYNNQTGGAFAIPHGVNNNLSGGTIIRGESVTQFNSGKNENAFKIRYTCTDTITWTLTGAFGTQTVSTVDAFDVECLDAIHVFVKCIANDGYGNFRATYGYENTGSDTVIIANPLQNFLTGNVISGSVLTQFIPGRHEYAFDIGYTGSELKWTLTGYDEYSRSATAFSMHVGKCFEPINIFVNCIRYNTNGTTTAVFGYENLNPWWIYIAGFPLNYLVYEDAGQLPANTFLQGKFDSAFSATFSGTEMKWALTGPDGVQHFAVANDVYCKLCDSIYVTNGGGERQFSISPNPATDVITISAAAAKKLSTIEITVLDVSGKQLMRHDFLSTGAVQLNIAALKRGFYIVKVKDNEKVSNLRVFKQ